ncbi:MAG: deoxyhypusine synthase [Pseudomonadota bacterium]
MATEHKNKSPRLNHRRRLVAPPMQGGSEEVATLIDSYFNAYNAARLREACQVLVQAINENATIGMSLAGALTPAGLSSVLTPLIERGFVDYVSSTGANLYHDLHYDLDLALYRGTAEVAAGAADRSLREQGIVRIYDILFPAEVLYRTDEWLMRVMMSEQFRKRMGTAELHYLIGRYALETARKTRVGKPSLLAVCHQNEVPVFTPSPGDSTIGLNLSAIYTGEPDNSPQIDPAIDVAEMAAIVHDAKRSRRSRSGVLIFGGGAPKNFLLQTEPQLQEILGVSERGHDYFVQVTDARPDTGGLSGATPSEAVSLGKIDPDRLPNTVVAYLDSTVALPLIASYVLARCQPRQPKRLYAKLPALVEKLRARYRRSHMYKKYWPEQT